MESRWYLESLEQTLEALQTSREGLSPEEVAKRLKRFGKNHLDIVKDRSLWVLFFSQFLTIFVFILAGAALIKFVLGHFLDAVVLVATVVILVFIGFFQEMKAEKALRALKQLSAHKSKVKRSGQIHVIDSKFLVPGDIILLEMGDKVPADARLLEVNRFTVDESMLSGESIASEKSTEALKEDVSLPDRKNMVYAGTVVSFGKAVAVVTETAERSELGKIASTLETIEQEPTPLQLNVQSISRWMAVSIVIAVSILIVIGLYSGMELSEILLLAVAAAISAMPEGLPAAFTVTLASGMRLMAKRNAIIRRMSAVETLGAATVICSDKTGTLTCNQMTATTLFADGKILSLQQAIDEKGKVLEKCNQIATLCNDASLSNSKDLLIVGESTESALLTAAIQSGIDVSELKQKYPRIGEIPFISENRYMATFHNNDGKSFVFIKGAPEKILSFSSSILKEQGNIALGAKEQEEVQSAISQMSEQALRLIAVAYCEVENGKFQEEDFRGKLVFCGIFGMIDPPRPEVIKAIGLCKKAGVRVVMVTGDNPITAFAIGKTLGIESKETLSGQELSALDDQALREKLKTTSIFARVEPIHKLRIVKAFQALGGIVAMTGDGINDAPALEAANIGVAMGISGTDVAKEAADIILADDRFDSIVAAIEEGRAIFNRLRNICTLLLLTCFGELFGLMLSVFATGLAPLLPLQIIWVNLASGAMVSIPLGMEPKIGNEMSYPPRSSSSRLLYSGMMYRIVFYAMLLGFGIFLIFQYGLKQYVDLDKARTMALCSLLTFEWLITLKMRSAELPMRKLGIFKNRILFMSIVLAISLHMCILYIPFFRELFKTEPLSLQEWGIVVIPGVFAFLIETLRKEFFPTLFRKGKWR
jgi:Ca2+-transporting ATPase